MDLSKRVKRQLEKSPAILPVHIWDNIEVGQRVLKRGLKTLSNGSTFKATISEKGLDRELWCPPWAVVFCSFCCVFRFTNYKIQKSKHEGIISKSLNNAA